MKILLDECVDERLADDFAGYNVLTVLQMGWKGKQNGELLALAEKRFEAFVTTDRVPVQITFRGAGKTLGW